MATGVITIKPLSAASATDVTAYADITAFELSSSPDSRTGVARIVLEDRTGALAGLVKHHAEVVVTVDGATAYVGDIVSIRRRAEGSRRIYELRTQAIEARLYQVVLTGIDYPQDIVGLNVGSVLQTYFGLRATLSGSDYLLRGITLHSDGVALVGIDGASDTITRAFDRNEVPLGEFLDWLAALVGARWWVDVTATSPAVQLRWSKPKAANLVTNGDFESGSTGWTLAGLASVGANSGPGGTGDSALVLPNSASFVTRTISTIVPGRRHLLRADVLNPSGVLAQGWIEWRNAGGTLVGLYELPLPAASSSWSRGVQVVSPAAATAATAKVVLKMNGTGTAMWDNIQLVPETAAWGASTSPDGTVTKAISAWETASESTAVANAAYVASPKIKAWRKHGGSLGYYGGTWNFEAVAKSDTARTSADVDVVADGVFAKRALPVESGSYKTRFGGIRPGTWQVIEIGEFGITDIVYITGVRLKFAGAGEVEYAVSYGAPPDGVGGLVSAISASLPDAQARARFVPVPYTAHLNNVTAPSTANQVVTLTSLPSGDLNVVAAEVVIGIRDLSGAGGTAGAASTNMDVKDYDSGAVAARTYTSGVFGRGGWLGTARVGVGGTNNQQIKWSASAANNTATCFLYVVGYWTVAP